MAAETPAPRRAAPLLVLVALLLAGATSGRTGAAAAAAATATATATVPGACTTTSGVTVVVDLSAFGQGVQVGCAPHPGDGFGALKQAGFTDVDRVLSFPGFVCRIAGEPVDVPGDCHHTPPTDAYWSYWYSTDHSSWTYTPLGAGNRTPPEGSVDGWSFVTGTGPAHPPAIAPPAAPSPRPSPPRTAPRSGPATAAPPSAHATGSTPTPPRSTGTSPPTATAPSTSAAPATASTTAAASTTSAPSRAPTGAAARSAGSRPEVRARSSVVAKTPPPTSGAPWGLVGGVGGAGVLAAGAIVIARRRRAAEAWADQDEAED